MLHAISAEALSLLHPPTLNWNPRCMRGRQEEVRRPAFPCDITLNLAIIIGSIAAHPRCKGRQTHRGAYDTHLVSSGVRGPAASQRQA